MILVNLILSILFIITGIILIIVSKKKIYKTLYIYRTISYILFLSSIFTLFKAYINIEEASKSLEVLTTISATIAGFVFAGISIIFALLNVEYINSLFKNNFLDKVFYKAYGVVALSIVNIAIFVLIRQFNLIFINELIIFYLYVFWVSILLYILMINDFVKVIKRAKGRNKR